ncbi:ABC transporter permease [Streptomyces sp. AP-93]|uniref:ABC transporter permease n=1 Tax=Streptomyces sp. AP-93 TaxID=2929048 RepID=UPI001FAE99B8|nr:ABC transporter permease [Streptomyces sp. AP-93]MCJ0872637.1 ABC transporter permease [Streptomyces sp. AP-93]
MSSSVSTKIREIPVTVRPVYRVTTGRVIRSEWAKFWSLRSSWITLGVAALLLVALGFIASASFDPSGTVTGPPVGPAPASDAVGLALTGTSLAQLAIGVLGVLVAAGEYSTGMIRSTLTAVPRRLPVLWAKALTFAAVALVACTVAVLAAFLVGSTQVSGTSAALSLSDDGVLRSLAGAALYLAMAGVLGVALGALLRSVAGGIAVLVASLMVLPGLTSLLPDSWADTVGPYLPSNAGDAMMSLHQTSDALSPGAGLAVLAGWVALVLGAAALRLVRTDV